jgi:hypothetical protein
MFETFPFIGIIEVLFPDEFLTAMEIQRSSACKEGYQYKISGSLQPSHRTLLTSSNIQS